MRIYGYMDFGILEFKILDLALNNGNPFGQW
jgi:hypothetical protein